MNKSVKFLTLLISVTFSMSVLGGCGNKSSDQSSTNSDTTVSDAKPGNPTLPIVSTATTLKIWQPIDANVTKTMKTLDESEFYKELEKRTGVHTEFVHPAIGQESQSLNLLLSSGAYPDIIQLYTGAYEYPGGLDKGISDGVILKLNDYVKKYAPNYNALMNSATDIKKEAVTDSGNIAVFGNIAPLLQPSWCGTVVRQDWLDDLGLKTPVTYDDWYNMLKAFKEKKGATAPMMLNYTGFTPFDIFNAGYGVGQKFYQVDGKVKFGPLEDGYKDYLTMINKWYKEGLIDKDFATKQDFIPSATFTTTGKTGAWNDIYTLLSIDKMQSKDPNYRVVAVPAPVKNVGDKLHLEQSNTRVGNAMWALTKNCKDPVTAVKWIDYLYSPDGVLLSNYGIEGKTYTKGSDGKPALTDFVMKNPDGLTEGQVLAKYIQKGAACEYHWERELQGQPKDNVDAPNIWGTNNDGSYYIPPTTLTTDEGTEYAQIMGDINTYISEMDVKFILGQEPLSNFNNFVNKIKSMNISRAIQLQQAALDRYNARK